MLYGMEKTMITPINQLQTSDEKDFSVDSISSEELKDLDFTYTAPLYMFFKRFFDLALSLILLIPIIIIMIIFGIWIKLDSKGPIIYKHRRIGKNMVPFSCYKLRSMYYNLENSGPEFTEENDSRITKVGKIIRRFRIDELPQVFNIILNQMSWIGPRPLTKFEYDKSDKIFENRTFVKPGISGLAQVNGGNDLMNLEKFKYDMKYIKNISLKMDLKVLFKTIYVVLTGDGHR